MEVLTLIIGILLGGIVGVIAEQKNRPFFPWAIYGFFAFFFAIIHISVIGDKAYEDAQLAGMGYVKCPACAEMVRRDALVCRHCRTNIREGAAVARQKEASPVPGMKHCRWCKAEVGTEDVSRCPSCGGLQKQLLRENPVLMVLLLLLVAAFFVVLSQVGEAPLPNAPVQEEISRF